MGKCCSKKENSITQALKKEGAAKQEAIIIVNNDDQTFEKIKIKRQGTGNADLSDREVVMSHREDKNDGEEKLLLKGGDRDHDKERDSSIAKIVPLHHEKKYKLHTDEHSLIKLAKNYSTDDEDLNHIVTIMNEPDELWEKILEDEVCKIQKKQEGDNQPILRTNAVIHGFTAKDIFDAIAIISNRLEWDKNFDEFLIVEQNLKEGSEVLYMLMKSPVIMVSQRDLVQKRRIWHPFPDSNGFLIHFKSIEHDKCPVLDKYVRAKTIISGYFMQTIQTDPPKTKICTISQTDLGGSLPKAMVNSLSSKAPKDWVKGLVKGLELLKSKKQ